MGLIPHNHIILSTSNSKDKVIQNIKTNLHEGNPIPMFKKGDKALNGSIIENEFEVASGELGYNNALPVFNGVIKEVESGCEVEVDVKLLDATSSPLVFILTITFIVSIILLFNWIVYDGKWFVFTFWTLLFVGLPYFGIVTTYKKYYTASIERLKQIINQ